MSKGTFDCNTACQVIAGFYQATRRFRLTFREQGLGLMGFTVLDLSDSWISHWS